MQPALVLSNQLSICCLKGTGHKKQTSCLRCCEPFYSLRLSCCVLKTSTGRSRASLEPVCSVSTDKEPALGLETVVPGWHRFLCWVRENELVTLKAWGRGYRDEAEATAQYAGSYLKFEKKKPKKSKMQSVDVKNQQQRRQTVFVARGPRRKTNWRRLEGLNSLEKNEYNACIHLY